MNKVQKTRLYLKIHANDIAFAMGVIVTMVVGIALFLLVSPSDRSINTVMKDGDTIELAAGNWFLTTLVNNASLKIEGNCIFKVGKERVTEYTLKDQGQIGLTSSCPLTLRATVDGKLGLEAKDQNYEEDQGNLIFGIIVLSLLTGYLANNILYWLLRQ